MRNILILDTGKEWGGGTNSLLELLRRVDKSRFKFTALFYDNYAKGGASDIRSELEKLGVGFIKIARPAKKAHVKILKEAGRAMLFLSPSLKKRFVAKLDFKERILPLSAEISKVIDRGRYDLLYMNNQPSSNFEGMIAAGRSGITCVQHSRVDVRLTALEAGAVNDLATKVICVSNRVKESLVESGVDDARCVVVHNGIDVSSKPARDREVVRAELGAKPRQVVIGTVCSLIKRKRVELLIEAFALLKESVSRCVIVGEGAQEKPLRDLAKKLGVAERVVFTGFSNDALSYINALDVFVLPSAQEGFARVVMEAMLMGKPVVAFDVAGTGEQIEDNVTGRLLTVETPKAIEEAVRGIIKAGPEKLGAAGRKRVKELFSIDRYVAKVSEILDAACEKR